MGLSPGKGKKKVEAQEEAAKKAIADVGTQSELDKMISDRAKRMLLWEDSKDPNKSILDAPGLSNFTDIYGNANEIAQQEQMGSGGMALANPASGAYKSQIEELGKNQRYDSRAEGLSNALQALKAQAYGMADQSIDRDMERKARVAGLNQNQLSQYYGRYKIQNPWYQKLWNFTRQAAPMAMQAFGGGG